MKIEMKTITVRELVKNYQNNEEEGVIGYDGKLDIRPPYQREFIYGKKEKVAVIESILRDYPLNVMYWVVNKDNNFEVLDGQQRTMSICEYVDGVYSIPQDKRPHVFTALDEDNQTKILDYELTVYFCEGTTSEKIEWFKIINTAGKKLTSQELLNAVYSGSWVTSAKKFFSKTCCVAYNLGCDYVKGTPIKQEYLEKALKWITSGKITVKDTTKVKTINSIEEYMSIHRHDTDSKELEDYFKKLTTWVKNTFHISRKKIMQSVEWGILYNTYGEIYYDKNDMEEKIQKLIMDDDVKNKSGIYPYLLTGKDKYLSLRTFSDSLKQKMYEKQKGVCSKCDNHFTLSQMEADHIIPWSKGGATVESNGQMLCIDCNRAKSDH